MSYFLVIQCVRIFYKLFDHFSWTRLIVSLIFYLSALVPNLLCILKDSWIDQLWATSWGEFISRILLYIKHLFQQQKNCNVATKTRPKVKANIEQPADRPAVFLVLLNRYCGSCLFFSTEAAKVSKTMQCLEKCHTQGLIV